MLHGIECTLNVTPVARRPVARWFAHTACCAPRPAWPALLCATPAEPSKPVSATRVWRLDEKGWFATRRLVCNTTTVQHDDRVTATLHALRNPTSCVVTSARSPCARSSRASKSAPSTSTCAAATTGARRGARSTASPSSRARRARAARPSMPFWTTLATTPKTQAQSRSEEGRLT